MDPARKIDDIWTQSGTLEPQNNPLDIPKDDGFARVINGNTVYKLLKNNGFESMYDAPTRVITVLKSSRMSPQDIRNIIYSNHQEYGFVIPRVEKGKNSDGNVQISLLDGQVFD